MPLPQPTISIVMPNYNHAQELQYSLAAITNQTRAPDEIIVVDDGSTDHSLNIINKFAQQCKTLRIVCHRERQGVVAAVNRGLREASADYVILASADERIMPDMCQEMEAALASFPHAQLFVARFTEWFAQTSHFQYGEDGECDLWFTDTDQPVWISPAAFRDLLVQRHVRLSVNSAMFKRTALLDVGMFDPALEWHSDWFAIYATALRHGFCALPRTLSWYRISRTSYSATGISAPCRQQQVVAGLLAKLDSDEFADIRHALLRAPSAMTPFMRMLLITLLKQPARYGSLARIAIWWMREAAQGRRPRIWARTMVAKALRRRLGKNKTTLAISRETANQSDIHSVQYKNARQTRKDQ